MKYVFFFLIYKVGGAIVRANIPIN